MHLPNFLNKEIYRGKENSCYGLKMNVNIEITILKAGLLEADFS